MLLVVALAYNAVISASLDPATWRVAGVLQPYAVIIVVVGTCSSIARRRPARSATPVRPLIALGRNAFIYVGSQVLVSCRRICLRP